MSVATIQKYSYINAKLRGKIGNLLSPEFLARMENSRSVAEILELLKTTSYRELNTIYDKTGDLKTCELALIKSEIEDMKKIVPDFGKSETPFLEALLMGFETDNIKNAFRLWFDHIIRNRDITARISYFYRDPILFDIDYDAVINTKEPKDIIPFFEGTPFLEILSGRLPVVIDSRSLFDLEIALDIFYFTHLLGSTKRLNRTDSAEATDFIRSEIDNENLQGALRVRNYYHIDRECFIPGGEIITKGIFDQLKNGTEEEMNRALERVLGSASPNPGSDYMKMLETIAKNHREKQLRFARKSLAGNPFTIGTLLAYILLKRSETGAVRHILNSKYYGK